MGRPRKFDPDDAIDRATRTFWTHGYAGTTPQILVDDLSIGRGSLYLAFGSKHELFVKCLERYVDTQTAGVVATLEGPGTVHEKVAGLLNGIVEANFADPNRSGCMMVNSATELAPGDEDVGRLTWRSVDMLDQALTAEFARAQRDGEVSADRTPSERSAMVLSAILGLQVMSKPAKSPELPRRVVDAVVAAL